MSDKVQGAATEEDLSDFEVRPDHRGDVWLYHADGCCSWSARVSHWSRAHIPYDLESLGTAAREHIEQDHREG